MSDSKNIPIIELTEKNLKAAILSMSDKVKQKIYPWWMEIEEISGELFKQ